MLSVNKSIFGLVSICLLINFGKSLPTSEKLKHSATSLWPEIGQSVDDVRQYYSQMLKSNMDSSVNPCEDFYSYACGNWEKHNSIPADMTRFSVKANLAMKISKSLRDLLSQPLQQHDQLGAEDKAKLLYSTCLDKNSIEKRGSKPLLDFIDSLGGWPVLDDNWNEDNFDLVALLAKMTRLGHQFFLSLGIIPKFDDTDKYAITIVGTELGLTYVAYMLPDENQKFIDAYGELIQTTLELLGVEKTKAIETANSIQSLEADFAYTSFANYDQKQEFVGTTLGELALKHPQIDLKRYFSLVFEKDIRSDQDLVLMSLPYFGKMIEFLASANKKDLANYLIWRNVLLTLNRLSEPFQTAHAKFNKVRMVKQTPPRWKVCVDFVESELSEIIRDKFDRTYFDYRNIDSAKLVTNSIMSEFDEALNNVDWIDDVTKQGCIKKLNATKVFIGYDEKILKSKEMNDRYKSLNIQSGKYFENALNLGLFRELENYKKLNQMVEKDYIPDISSSTVNAFYASLTLKVIIPLSGLQHPLYHRKLPKALQYGGFGFCFGHELTHGFDDNGREFDRNGNKIEWWTQKSVDKFNEKAECFVDQYGKYSIDEYKISGNASKSENIADNGAIRFSFKGYKKWLETASSNDLKNENLPNLDMTGEQLFFLLIAQQFCEIYRPEILDYITTTEEHCIGKFRTIGTLSNSHEFSKAFQCPVGSPMNPEKKCQLW